MLNGLDLFSGIGGLSIALREWVKPIAYCEIDPYCQGILLSRMASGDLSTAPIWDNIINFKTDRMQGGLDIIYGGFPCQDISVAGHGKGLAGERSGLFFEIVRLAKEIKPPFIFLENVPAITSRGGLQVISEIAEMGYDSRWCVISAESVGALHLRERWFLLAHSKTEYTRRNSSEEQRSDKSSICNSEKRKESSGESKGMDSSSSLANSKIERREKRGLPLREKESLSSSNGEDISNATSIPPLEENCNAMQKCARRETRDRDSRAYWPYESRKHWQEVVSSICRVSNGVSNRVDKLRALGNAVVPMQAREAFRILAGINDVA